MNRKILSSAAAVTASIAAALTAPAGTAVADTPPPVAPRIIGGHPAATAPPGITSLQYDAPAYGEKYIDYHTCGAALVFRGWVVTAAHCVTDPPAGAAARSSAIQRFTADAAPIPTADNISTSGSAASTGSPAGTPRP